MKFLSYVLNAGVVVVAAAMVLVTMQCDELVQSEVSTNLNLKVAVTEDFQAGAAQALQKPAFLQEVATDSGLTLNEKVSFTPSSMKIYLKTAYLYTQYPPENGNNLTIPLNQEIDLIGQSAMTDLLFQDMEVDSAEFDDYTPYTAGGGRFHYSEWNCNRAKQRLCFQ